MRASKFPLYYVLLILSIANLHKDLGEKIPKFVQLVCLTSADRRAIINTRDEERTVSTMNKIFMCDYALIDPDTLEQKVAFDPELPFELRFRDFDADRFEVHVLQWREDIVPTTAQELRLYKLIKPYLYKA